MKLIIDTSEEDLDCVKYLKAKGWASRHELQILNGTPLDDVLDKIKSEIKQLPYQRIFGKVSSYSLLDTVVEIIDKYKAESEKE